MNILKKLDAANEWRVLEIKFALQHHLGWTTLQCKDFIQALFGEKKSLKNYWLEKKETKERSKEQDAKIDEIANLVTKYISSRKLKDK